MNKNLLVNGMLLQIPNVFILTALFIFWIIPFITLHFIIWVIGGSVYAILNILSIIFIITGLTS